MRQRSDWLDYAGVVDQYIGIAEPLAGGIDHCLDRDVVRDIA